MTLTLPGSAALPKRRSRARRRPVVFDTMLGRTALQTLAVIAFFALWEFGVRVGWVSAFLVGSPSGIFSLAWKMTLSGDLLSDTWYTLFEAILGFVIGVVSFVVSSISPVAGFIVTLVSLLLWIVLAIAILISWVVCLIKAWQGKSFKLPIVGRFAESMINK